MNARAPDKLTASRRGWFGMLGTWFRNRKPQRRSPKTAETPASEQVFLERLNERFRNADKPAGDDEVTAVLHSFRARSPNLRVVPRPQVDTDEGRGARLIRGRFPEPRPKNSPALRNWRRVGLGFALAASGLAVVVWMGGREWLFPADGQAMHEQAVLPNATAPLPFAELLMRSEVVLSAGQVRVDGELTRLGRAPLRVGQSVTTERGRVCLLIDPGIEVCTGADTALRVESLFANSLSLRVLQGEAVARLPRLPPGYAFSLTAPSVQARAIGTVFAVCHDPARARSDVAVLEGEVSVILEGGQVVALPVHQRLSIDARQALSTAYHVPARQTLSRVEEAPWWAALSDPAWWRPSELGVLEVSAASGRVTVDGDATFPLPLQTFVPAGEHELQIENESGQVTTTRVDVAVGRVSAVDAASLPASFETPSPTTVKHTAKSSEPVTAAALLHDARTLRQQGKTARALQAYGKLQQRFPGSPEARTVLVTMGKLELELGRPARALEWFERYLRGSGPLAPEAWGGKVQALGALGRQDAERRAMQQYLTRYPDGFLARKFRERLQVRPGR